MSLGDQPVLHDIIIAYFQTRVTRKVLPIYLRAFVSVFMPLQKQAPTVFDNRIITRPYLRVISILVTIFCHGFAISLPQIKDA